MHGWLICAGNSDVKLRFLNPIRNKYQSLVQHQQVGLTDCIKIWNYRICYTKLFFAILAVIFTPKLSVDIRSVCSKNLVRCRQSLPGNERRVCSDIAYTLCGCRKRRMPMRAAAVITFSQNNWCCSWWQVDVDRIGLIDIRCRWRGRMHFSNQSVSAASTAAAAQSALVQAVTVCRLSTLRRWWLPSTGRR